MGKTLHEAAREGDVTQVRALLEKKWWRPAPDVNAIDKWGCTPLHYAAESGSVEIAVLLLDLGAEIAPVNLFADMPIHNAAREGRVELVGLLLDRGADINAVGTEGATPLRWAAREGHVGLSKLLIARGADQSIRDKEGRTPRELAAVMKQADVVRLLDQS